MFIDFTLVVCNLVFIKRLLRHVDGLFTAHSRTSWRFYLFQPKRVRESIVPWTGIIGIDPSFANHRFSKHLLWGSSPQNCVDVWIVIGWADICHLLLIHVVDWVVSLCLFKNITRLLVHWQLAKINTENWRAVLGRWWVCLRQIWPFSRAFAKCTVLGAGIGPFVNPNRIR